MAIVGEMAEAVDAGRVGVGLLHVVAHEMRISKLSRFELDEDNATDLGGPPFIEDRDATVSAPS